jgi:hypothetical protein
MGEINPGVVSLDDARFSFEAAGLEFSHVTGE